MRTGERRGSASRNCSIVCGVSSARSRRSKTIARVPQPTRDLYRARLRARGRTVWVRLRVGARKVRRRNFGVCERVRRDNRDVDERDVCDWPADRGAAAARSEAAARVAMLVTARRGRVCSVLAGAVHRVRAHGVHRMPAGGRHGLPIMHWARVKSTELRERGGEPKSPNPDKGPKPERTAHNPTIHPGREKFTLRGHSGQRRGRPTLSFRAKRGTSTKIVARSQTFARRGCTTSHSTRVLGTQRLGIIQLTVAEIPTLRAG